MAANGVFCLEGEWHADLRQRESVLPVLELLERLGYLKAIHRDVATRTEMEHYLKTWSQKRYGDFHVLYLATHGNKGVLSWSRGKANQTSLKDLAEVLGDSAKGRYIHFGSCLTLFDEKQALAFAQATGAAAVTGYRKEVDWLEGAAFEVLLLAALANHNGRPKTLFNQLMNRHRDLAKLYKFVMVTQKDVLPSHDVVH